MDSHGPIAVRTAGEQPQRSGDLTKPCETNGTFTGVTAFRQVTTRWSSGRPVHRRSAGGDGRVP